MDQDKFRQLLQTPRAGGSSSSTSTSRGSLLAAAVKPKPSTSTAGVAFKPRKVKKATTSANDKYRDRASERRVGDVNDYAEVEAVLEDFERRTASLEDKESVESQRRYLGGDSVHTILVKGLDHSLLEQNRAQAELSTGALDDDSLEQAFQSVASTSQSAPPERKRTRQELIQELKNKRQQGASTQGPASDAPEQGALEESQQLENAKRAGKFKPIGFTPVGASEGKRKKPKDGVADGERRKKKKRKVEVVQDNDLTSKGQMLPPPLPELPGVAMASDVKANHKLPPTPEPMVEDFDIFGGVGDYEGNDLGPDDDDEDSHEASRPNDSKVGIVLDVAAESTGKWFAPSEGEQRTKTTASVPLPVSVLRHAEGSSSKEPDSVQRPSLDNEEGEVTPTARLVPLSSSALPSIKDFLAMDKARDKPWKGKKGAPRKAPEDSEHPEGEAEKESSKGKTKGKGAKTEKGKMTAEAKAERDYKRLKTYEEKKAGGSRT